MKIPSALARIQEGLHGAVECMNRQADKMAVLNSELHAAGDHIKNAGRIFRGKELEKVETQAVDKGITVKIRKSFLALSGRLSSMEQTTDNAVSYTHLHWRCPECGGCTHPEGEKQP